MNAQQFCQCTLQYREHFTKIAFNFFHSTEVAEDIVQDTLLRLWTVHERLATDEDFHALGIRIAKNRCVDEWRRQQQLLPTEEGFIELSSSSDTSAQLEEAEDQRRLHNALAHLTPTEQRIFTLWNHEQLSVAEIGTLLHCKTTTVSNTLSKVKRKLFQILQSTS